MSLLLPAFETNQLFWRAFDTLLHHVLRFAKRIPQVSVKKCLHSILRSLRFMSICPEKHFTIVIQVSAWLYAHRAQLVYIDTWLTQNAKPPGPRSQTMFLHKVEPASAEANKKRPADVAGTVCSHSILSHNVLQVMLSHWPE
jgi:hypothetical protein